LCDNLFLLNFKGLSLKKIKYIHQHLRYYENIEQNSFYGSKKIESYVCEKKIQGAQLWKGKRKRSHFFNWPYPM
jgi:hypothetical protein